jgi:hypothetical protein
VISKFLESFSVGYGVVTIGNELINIILVIMKDDFNMNREDDFLSWWLYEDVDKVIYDDDKKN